MMFQVRHKRTAEGSGRTRRIAIGSGGDRELKREKFQP
jgi:hypothetical protein